MKKNILALSVICALGLGFSSFANAGALKVGATPVPHSEILEFVKPIVAKQGVELEIVEFNDYVQPNLAVSDGELDANYFQHRPYLDTFVADHGSDLVSVAGIHIEPMGVYSKNIKKLDELKKGDVIAIPNDPTNGGRALLLLHSAGLIKVADPTDVTTTVLDIIENKKDLEFKELEAAQLPRSLGDVTAAVINTNFAMPAGLNPLKDAIVIENADSPYVNIVAANTESSQNPDMQILIKALESKETADFIKEKYQGSVIPVTEGAK